MKPSRLIRAIQRFPGWIRAAIALRNARTVFPIHLAGSIVADLRGRASIGARTFFLATLIPCELGCAVGADLIIGSDTGFNYGASVVAAQSIRIGSHCLIASMVRIRDDDGLRRAPIVIGDNVWIAHGAIIEPGVTIGDGAVISAGSVVTSNVPAGMLAAGNPARCVPLNLTRSRTS